MTVAEFRMLFHRDIQSFIHEFEMFTEKDLYITVGTVINPAANLGLHIAGNLQHYLGFGLGKIKYTRNRDFEFNARDVPGTAIEQELKKAYDVSMATFDKIQLVDLSENYPDLSPWGGYSKGFVLMQLLAHLNYHKGQLNYLRRSLDK
jgi:hypothetical protein